jgi:hypothetical protein
MRALVLAILLGACGGAHPATTDRLDCDSCHASLFDSTTIHAALGITSRACYQCHGLTAWTPANANHTKFPIGEEPHAGYDCADCHLSVDDPTQITCITCHAHRKARVDAQHPGVGDYTYSADSCLSCHPNGRVH